MENEVERFSVLRLTGEGRSNVEEIVARELPLTIILNNRELVTLLCSPNDLKHLAVGFLFSEGLLTSKDEIKKIVLDDQRGVIRLETVDEKEVTQEVLSKRLITSGCGGGISYYRTTDAITKKLESQVEISADEVFALIKEFQHSSELHLTTHGVHTATLCDEKSILVFSEDIGRHNAIDKIFGKCLLEDIPTDDHIVITSGRVSSEIVHKIAKRGIPIIISISAPTNLGVRIANDLGITLIGFARGRRMNVYTNEGRVN